MFLSRKAKYGLRAMLYLASQQCGTLVTAGEVSNAQRIPKKFLSAILVDLRVAGLVYSKKGRGGGFELATEPDRITVGDVIRLLNGPITLLPCASTAGSKRCSDCLDVEFCRVRRLMAQVRDAMVDVLDHMPLSSLPVRPQAEREVMVLSELLS